MKRYLISVAFLVLFFNSKTFGQYSEANPAFKPLPSPQAPNAGVLGKFGDYNVSFFSGVPDITIPLYEIKVGNLNVPIAIRYHASGLKVTDVSSWVGLGWALDAGGQISRRVMGAKEDEAPAGNGYINHPKRLASSINSTLPDDQAYLEQLYKNYYDTEPDIYSYNFPTGNGKFFLNYLNNYQPEPIPFTPIKIQRIGDNQSFLIVDKEGNSYDYATKDQTYTGNGPNSRGTWGACFLDKITAVDTANNIKFKYTNQYTTTSFEDIQDTWVIDDNVVFYSDWPAGGVYGSRYNSNPQASVTASPVSNNATEQSLQEINFKNGKVVFEMSGSVRQDMTSAKSLNRIKIYNYDFSSQLYQLIKTVTFFQSYFAQGTDHSRLRLDSVQILNSTSAKVESYKFNYNAIELPKTNSRSRDFWGYYNGRSITSLIPRQTITYVEGDGISGGSIQSFTIGATTSNGRDPDTVNNQASMLKRIYYPGGGYTDFNFETNRYTELGVTKFSGGLRVKSISNYDGINPSPVVKTYAYNSARANYVLNNFYFETTQNYRTYFSQGGGATLNAQKRVRTFMSSPTIDLIPYDQALVVYPVVTEYLGTSAVNIGKTVYTFTDAPDVVGTSVPHKPYIISNFYKRGLLKDKSVYKNNGLPNYQLVHQEQNDYFSFPQKTVSNAGLITFQTMIHEGTAPATIQKYNSWYYINYEITSGDSYLIKKTVKDIDPLNPSNFNTVTNSYRYANIQHQQITQDTTVNSTGEKTITNLRYPLDFVITGTPTSSDAIGIKNLQDKGVIGALVEKYTQKSNSDGSSLRTLFSDYLSYYPDMAHVKSGQQLENSGPVTTFTPAQITASSTTLDSRYKPAVTFNSYDLYGNVLEHEKTGGAKTSYKWSYNKQYPIAEVKNSAVNEIYTQNFEEPELGLDFEANVVNDNAQVHTGKYSGRIINPNATEFVSHSSKRLNISLTAPKKFTFSGWVFSNGPSVQLFLFMMKAGETGYNTYYDHIQTTTTNKWVYMKKEFLVPADVVQMFLRLDNNAAGTVWFDDLRIQPSDASMSTYTYDPLVGMTSAIDDSGKTVYYEYDTFQRLMNIKDQNGFIIKNYDYHYKP
jgi:hypothetical protein